MRYVVTADREDANSADVAVFDSMVDAVRDMVALGLEPPDAGGPIGWTITTTTVPEGHTP